MRFGNVFTLTSRRISEGTFMTHVVTDTCIQCKYTDCVDVCPFS